MKLSSVTIQNYKALDEITIPLNPSMNVIYGINGMGKSSILYALHDFLHLLSSHVNVSPDYHLFPDWVLRDSKKETKIEINVLYNFKASATLPSQNVNKLQIDHVYNWKTYNQLADGTIIHNTCSPTIKLYSFFPGKYNSSIISEIMSKIFINLSKNKNTNNLYEDDINFVSLYRGINYTEFKRGFEKLENLENQKRIYDSDYRDPILEKIRKTISRFSDDLKNITIDREQKDNPLCVLKNGKLIDIEHQMSSGEANIVGLIGQIALNVYTTQATLDTSCIVLIDEIDNSLHPQWQVKICNLLKKAFPEVQFIVSSHSPFVWSELDRDEVIWLERDSEGKVVRKPVDYAKGGTIEEIIAAYFGVPQYGRDIADEVHAIDALIEQGDADAARKAMSEMRNRYGNLPIFSLLEFRMRILGL